MVDVEAELARLKGRQNKKNILRCLDMEQFGSSYPGRSFCFI